jgi:hypothetical protein
MPSPVSVVGATSTDTQLLTKRQAKLAAKALTTQFNTSAVNSSLVPSASFAVPQSSALGADTISAGTQNLLISIGGVDTLGTLQFPMGQHGHKHAAANTQPVTPGGSANIGFAAAGNLTLLGGAFTVQAAAATTPAPPTPPEPGIDTVFGAAMAGSVMVFDHGQPAVTGHHDTVASAAKAPADLLLGWTFPEPGQTVDLGKPANAGKGAHLSDGTDVQITGLPEKGVIEVIFHKPG